MLLCQSNLDLPYALDQPGFRRSEPAGMDHCLHEIRLSKVADAIDVGPEADLPPAGCQLAGTGTEIVAHEGWVW